MTNQIVPDFIQVPASALSLSCRKPVYGVGINDAGHTPLVRTAEGKRYKCPYYVTWAGMLKRCYSPRYQERYPTYAGCSVAPEWHSFMTFRAWMAAQDWSGKALDKDVLVPGNKSYSPDTCAFIDQATNKLLTDSKAARGACPLGVSVKGGRYRASCKVNGSGVYLGVYDTPELAHAAYRACKSRVVWEAANLQTDPRVKAALLRYSAGLAGGVTLSAA